MRVLFFTAMWVLLPSLLVAQTTHPLLIAALDSAERLAYGSYRLSAVERHSYSKDSIFYRGHVAFSRFEHLDGRPGLRYEADVETQYPSSLQRLRIVFDGRFKYVLYGDSLAQRYDTQRLGLETHQFHNGSLLFFIPMLLHTPSVNKYYGLSKEFGIPPYQTLGDTLIGKDACTLVVAHWTADDAEDEHSTEHYVCFGIEKRSGLPIYFRYSSERKRARDYMPSVGYLLEIKVEELSTALPKNSFYMDWQGLPSTFEVREFYDCYNREILRPRMFEGL